MKRTIVAGIGHYVPERVVTNDDLAQLMDTSDEWITERTGIKERRFLDKSKETTTTMAAEAARLALDRAGMKADEIDFIVFATLSPDYYFPGCGVLLQRELGITNGEVGALDIRNQCSGFVYGLSVADQFIKTGMYRNVLLVGAEAHSMGLDLSTRGRSVSVIFGDGAGAAILQSSEDEERGVLTSVMHADGTHAEELALLCPGSHAGFHTPEVDYGFSENPNDPIFVTQKMLDEGAMFPYMNGQLVFKTAVRKFPEVIMEALNKTGLDKSDIDLFIPHQANLRISQFVQKRLGLNDDQVYNNIMRYGNTTAASIPIAMSEAWEEGRLKEGDLLCLAAFGSGFTWASALIRW